jgi:hypothetical protein
VAITTFDACYLRAEPHVDAMGSVLDSDIVAVSLPAIARSLNAAFADTEWIVSAYVLTFAAT